MSFSVVLVFFPALCALASLVTRDERIRAAIVVSCAMAVGLTSVLFAVTYIGLDYHYEVAYEPLDVVAAIVDLSLAGYVLFRGVRDRRPVTVLLACAQLAVAAVIEFAATLPAQSIDATMVHNVRFDSLASVMVLVVGVVGSCICVYALGYMHMWQAARPEGEPDRGNVFFATVMAFLSGMFVLVLSDRLTWVMCGWELTTTCSFVLIGYPRTPEAIANAHRQIEMNLVGGIAFGVAVAYAQATLGIGTLSTLVAIGVRFPAVVVLPVVLLVVAAITKAAQMPFHTWLLGAMVAPTPVSALLHSSTMVKAAIYLLIRLMPLFGLNLPGITLMLVGGTTFLAGALLAITQSNAKRVLAYSTVSNLGLICACCGIGTSAAMWAALALTVFHALAKSLLFLTVGAVEQCIGSRDIEDMDGLFLRCPRLARLLILGISGMFIAPFGMAISKWAALGAFAGSGNLLLVMLFVFGSGATYLFWAKWLAKISALSNRPLVNQEGGVPASERAALGTVAALLVAATVLFPVLSEDVFVPMIGRVYGSVTTVISTSELWFMVAVAVLVISVFALAHPKALAMRHDRDVYMGGVGMGGDVFENSLSMPEHATQSNWYMEEVLSVKAITLFGELVCGITLAVVALAALVPAIQAALERGGAL